MSCTPLDLLIMSRELAHTGGEAYLRNSASKAYYAMYHQARNYATAESLPSPDRKMGSHEKLAKRLEDKGGELKELSYVLTASKKIRHAADYDLDTAFLEDQAEAQIETATEFLRRLNEFARAKENIQPGAILRAHGAS